MARSVASMRGVLLLVVIHSISPLSFISSAAPTRQSYDISTHSLEGSADLRDERSFPTILPLKANDVNSSRPLTERRRRSLLGAARMPLHDGLLSKGYYTSTISIGNPQREFALIVDTGSTVTYVPCSSCTHCGTHQDVAFKPADSTTYEAIPCTSPSCYNGLCDQNHQCKYERQYAESSTSAGVLGKDQFGFGDNADLGSPKLMFGCENAETGDLFYQRADGIMGLGRGQLSIVDQLVKESDMSDTFSLCYGGMDQQGGNMIMGDFPSPPGMVFTASDPRRSPYYNVVLKKIKVAGTALPVDPNVFNAKFGTVLDSGTTYAYLPEKAFNEFKRAVVGQLNLKAVAGPDPQFEDFCFEDAGSDPKTLSEYFPSVELEFGDGVSLALDPENYLFKHTQRTGAYCLGVFKNDNDHTTLLGGILVRDMLVKYDRANNQIGFWPTNCTDLWTSLKDAYDGKNPPIDPFPKSEVKNPPAEQTVDVGAPEVSIKIPDEHIGGLELNISVAANYTVFDSLSSAFVEDMARDLELEARQVKLLDFQEHGPDVDVTCAVSPASFESPLPRSTVENIIGRLQQHRVQFRNDFGSYHLNKWRVIPEERSSWAEKTAGLALGIVIMTVVLSGGVAFWIYRRSRDRTRNVKYVTVDPLGYNASQQL
ncbi:unnamed protein product [Calypogeia fissa]